MRSVTHARKDCCPLSPLKDGGLPSCWRPAPGIMCMSINDTKIKTITKIISADWSRKRGLVQRLSKTASFSGIVVRPLGSTEELRRRRAADGGIGKRPAPCRDWMNGRRSCGGSVDQRVSAFKDGVAGGGTDLVVCMTLGSKVSGRGSGETCDGIATGSPPAPLPS